MFSPTPGSRIGRGLARLILHKAGLTKNQVLVAADNLSACQGDPRLTEDGHYLTWSGTGEGATQIGIAGSSIEGLVIVPNSGNQGSAHIVSYSTNGPNLAMYNVAPGTLAVPGAVPSGTTIYNNSAWGGNGTTIVRASRILTIASQNWSGSVNGAALEFETVPNGSSGNSTTSAIFQSGWQCYNAGVAPTGGDKGGGTVNVQGGYYTQGVLNGTQGFTVATLPASPGTGARAYVTDATGPTFLGTLTGGGTVKCPVFYNGTAWVAG